MVRVGSADELLELLGSCGLYQIFQFFIHMTGSINSGLQMLSLNMMAPIPDHWCIIPGVDNNNISNEVKDKYIPTLPDGRRDKCKIMDPETKKTTTCSEYHFDTTYFPTSAAIDYTYVCDESWVVPTVQSAFMFGVLFGSYFFGILADKRGRKLAFCICGFGMFITSATCGYVAFNRWLFIVMYFVYGFFGTSGCYLAGFTMAIELSMGHIRTLMGMIRSSLFGISLALVALYGYLCDDYHDFQWVVACHALLTIVFQPCLDESPRWLWSQGRHDEAIAIVQKGLKLNGSDVVIDGGGGVAATIEQKKIGLSHLPKHKAYFIRCLIMCGTFFANSLGYFGFSLNTDKLSGNPYFNLALCGLLEIPGYVITFFVLEIFGRKKILIVALFGSSLFGFGSCVVERGSVMEKICFNIGKVWIAIAFTVSFLYINELFPTRIRTSVQGLAVVAARIAGVLTPIISTLHKYNYIYPQLIFSTIIFFCGIPVFFLPETLGKPLQDEFGDEG